MKKLYRLFIIYAVICCPAIAQTKIGGLVELDRTVYDFGDIQISQGAVSCSYNVKNISTKNVTIFNVITSCGCTEARWTKEAIKPGSTGTITATYKNEDGPYPFDKTLTVYISDMKQPVVLRLRGVAHEKTLPLSEMYPIHFGALGMKSVEIKGGNMSQGQQKSGELKIANLGGTAMDLTFADVSDGLSLKLSTNPIPAGATATLSYTMTASRERWGKNWYYATPVVNGRKFKASGKAARNVNRGEEAVLAEPNPRLGEGHGEIGFWGYTKEDFSGWTREQKSAGANPIFESSTFSFNPVKAGTKVDISFDYTNSGKSTLKFYKLDPDSSRVRVESVSDVQPGGKGKIKATLDTAGLPAGEVLIVVTITTNAPLRPLVNLYISGFIK